MGNANEKGKRKMGDKTGTKSLQSRNGIEIFELFAATAATTTGCVNDDDGDIYE